MWNDLTILQLAEERCSQCYPPRLLFGKGLLVEGRFRPYMSMEDYTAADFLCDPHQETPVMVRFSSATSQPGSGDTGRDLRTMEGKFYTKEGNCDWISISLPMNLCQTGKDLLDMMEVIGPSKKTGLRENWGYLDYAVSHPWAMAAVLELFGNRGIPKSYSCMESWSLGTSLWRNSKGELFFVRFQWTPEEPVQYISENEGEFLWGFDPDAFHRRFRSTVSSQRSVIFELQVQIISADSRILEHRGISMEQLCDPTVLWNPFWGEILRVGRLMLDRIPEEEPEHEALFCTCPDQLVKGMEIMEGSFLHELSLILRTLQSARLGKERTKALINGHHRCRRASLIPTVTRIKGWNQQWCYAEGREPYHREMAREVWDSFSREEQEAAVKSMAQRLVFGPEDLTEAFLKEMEKIGPQILKSIEKQLLF